MPWDVPVAISSALCAPREYGNGLETGNMKQQTALLPGCVCTPMCSPNMECDNKQLSREICFVCACACVRVQVFCGGESEVRERERERERRKKKRGLRGRGAVARASHKGSSWSRPCQC